MTATNMCSNFVGSFVVSRSRDTSYEIMKPDFVTQI